MTKRAPRARDGAYWGRTTAYRARTTAYRGRTTTYWSRTTTYRSRTTTYWTSGSSRLTRREWDRPLGSNVRRYGCCGAGGGRHGWLQTGSSSIGSNLCTPGGAGT